MNIAISVNISKHELVRPAARQSGLKKENRLDLPAPLAPISTFRGLNSSSRISLMDLNPPSDIRCSIFISR